MDSVRGEVAGGGWSEAQAVRALLQWQAELGAVDAIGIDPVDRYSLPEARPPMPGKPAPVKDPARAPTGAESGEAPADAKAADTARAAEFARQAAASADTLDALRAAIESFDHCDLKRGARRTVFADGVPESRLMIVGEAPGREEDREGRPFVGRAGKLLDRMLHHVGFDRNQNAYIANAVPWRPPENRAPTEEEIEIMRPFLLRQIELARPELVLAMGNTACQALFGKTGIIKLRGNLREAEHVFCGCPVMPTFHPAFLLRSPKAKGEVWADLLEVKARLDEGGTAVAEDGENRGNGAHGAHGANGGRREA